MKSHMILVVGLPISSSSMECFQPGSEMATGRGEGSKISKGVGMGNKNYERVGGGNSSVTGRRKEMGFSF